MSKRRGFQGISIEFEIERNAAMEQLKVFGRNAANADPIFTKEVDQSSSRTISTNRVLPRVSKY